MHTEDDGSDAYMKSDKEETAPETAEFPRVAPRETGRALVIAMQSSPFREIEIEPKRRILPVRSFALS
jgi:hypothetical protein